MKKNSVILVDQSRLFTDAIKNILTEETQFEILCNASCGIDAIRNAKSLKPDILVVGQMLPDITMYHVVREVYRDLKNTKFLFIVHDGDSELLKFLGELQTLGVIRHDSEIKELIFALDTIARGERYLSKDVISDLRLMPEVQQTEDLLTEITPREREVLYWLAHGQNNKEIASTMILSEKTIKNHITHLLKKLNVTNRTRAAAIAWSEGLPLIPEEFFSPSGGR